MKVFFTFLTASLALTGMFYGCATSVPTVGGKVVNLKNPDFVKEAGVDETLNPHKGGNCAVCHKATEQLLLKESPSDGDQLQRKAMKSDLIHLCIGCHKSGLEEQHPVGKATKLNKEALPLDHDGKMNCASTCHDMHTPDPVLKKGLLRLPTNDLCYSCHDV